MDLSRSDLFISSSPKTTKMKNYQVNSIKSLLGNAKSALVVSPQLSIDSIAASLSLGLALNKKNISTRVFCPQTTDQNYSKLSGLQLLTDTYNDNNLVISIDHPLDQIDQVSYNDDNNRLNLVVKTKPDSPQIDNQKIHITNNSFQFDLGFMLGDETPLGQQAGLVTKGNWVLVSPQNLNKTWAKASIIDQDAPFCEIFSFLLPQLNLPLDADSGKNLLIGLRVATQSFSVNVSPETFEAGARCLRATQSQKPQPSSPSQTTPLESVETSPQSKFQPQKSSSLPTS